MLKNTIVYLFLTIISILFVGCTSDSGLKNVKDSGPLNVLIQIHKDEYNVLNEEIQLTFSVDIYDKRVTKLKIDIDNNTFSIGNSNNEIIVLDETDSRVEEKVSIIFTDKTTNHGETRIWVLGLDENGNELGGKSVPLFYTIDNGTILISLNNLLDIQEKVIYRKWKRGDITKKQMNAMLEVIRKEEVNVVIVEK